MKANSFFTKPTFSKNNMSSETIQTFEEKKLLLSQLFVVITIIYPAILMYILDGKYPSLLIISSVRPTLIFAIVLSIIFYLVFAFFSIAYIFYKEKEKFKRNKLKTICIVTVINFVFLIPFYFSILTFQEEKPKLAETFRQKQENTIEGFSAETFLNEYVNKRREEIKIEDALQTKKEKNAKELATIKKIIE